MEETPSVFIDPSLLEVDRRPERREKSPDITPVQPAKRKKTKEVSSKEALYMKHRSLSDRVIIFK